MPTGSLRTFIRVVTAVVLAGPAIGQAPDSRVVVLIFPGSGGDRARDVVVAALGREHEVIGPEAWEKAAGRLGETTGASRAEVSRIAPELRARAVFSGNVGKRGAGMSFSLVARDGTSGEVIDAGRFPMRGYDFKKAVAQQVEEFALRAAGKGNVGQPTLPPEAPPRLPEVVAVIPPPPPPPSDRPTFETPLDVQLGLGVVGRWFEQGTPQDYGVFPVGAFDLRADVWPFFRRGGGLSNIGIGVGYGQVFSMTSSVDNSELPGCDGLATTLRHLDAGLRTRWNPSRSERGVTLRGQVGWEMRTFSIDGDACPNFAGAVPNATHQMVRLGIGARLPVGPDPLALHLDGAYLHVTGDSGDIDGDGGFGVEGAGGADWRVTSRGSLGLRVTYTHVKVDAPAANLVDSAVDRTLSMLATASYAL